MDNGRWDIVLFRNGMLGHELKTPELSTCFHTDEKIGETNWDGPSVPMATQNARWVDYLKSAETTGWDAWPTYGHG
jgi:hypothetical protein